MKRAQIELIEGPAGRTVVVTGPWSESAADVLRRGNADGLVLNYARGFEGFDLEFLSSDLRVRRLELLDRGIIDTAPIRRLSGTLEELSIQVAEGAQLDLAPFSHLRVVAGDWRLIGPSLSAVRGMAEITTWRFEGRDLREFSDFLELQALTIKDAPSLESVDGVGGLSALRILTIALAPRLTDISDVAPLVGLQELQFDECRGLETLDVIERLHELRTFGCADCGDIASFAPLAKLVNLEEVFAWGSTRVLDDNLAPLAELPCLRELRLKSRRRYRPPVAELKAKISERGGTRR